MKKLKIFGVSLTVLHYTLGFTLTVRKWKLSASLHFNPKGDGIAGAGLWFWLLGYAIAIAAGRENM